MPHLTINFELLHTFFTGLGPGFGGGKGKAWRIERMSAALEVCFFLCFCRLILMFKGLGRKSCITCNGANPTNENIK